MILELSTTIRATRPKHRVPRVEFHSSDIVLLGEIVAVIAGLGLGVEIAVGSDTILLGGARDGDAGAVIRVELHGGGAVGAIDA